MRDQIKLKQAVKFTWLAIGLKSDWGAIVNNPTLYFIPDIQQFTRFSQLETKRNAQV